MDDIDAIDKHSQPVMRIMGSMGRMGKMKRNNKIDVPLGDVGDRRVNPGNQKIQELLYLETIGKGKILPKAAVIEMNKEGYEIAASTFYEIIEGKRNINFDLARAYARATGSTIFAEYLLPEWSLIVPAPVGLKITRNHIKQAIRIIGMTAKALEDGSEDGGKISLEEAREIAREAERLRLAVEKGYED